MELPTRGELIEKRSALFKEGISETIVNGKLDFFHKLVDDLVREHECTPEHVAAAMAYLLQKDRPLEPSGGHADAPRSDREGFAYGDQQNQRERPTKRSKDDNKPAERVSRRERTEQRKPVEKQFTDVLSDNDVLNERPRPPRKVEHNPADDGRAKPLRDYPDIPMERFRIQVGHKDGVTPREVVGAIANEAEIEGRYIGHIRIYDDYCTVDLPGGMPKEVMQVLQKTHVCSKPLNIEPVMKSNRASPSIQVRTPRADRPKKESPKVKPDTVKVEKASFASGKSKDITREVLERFPDLEAPTAHAKPKAGKAKLKKRTDKDKGKRRSPSKKPL
jgi:ATP-dependent RNA helicase DeaD